MNTTSISNRLPKWKPVHETINWKWMKEIAVGEFIDLVDIDRKSNNKE